MMYMLLRKKINIKEVSMDTFHKKIENINPEDNFERYCVNESDNVIVDAFSKKSAVHAGSRQCMQDLWIALHQKSRLRKF